MPTLSYEDYLAKQKIAKCLEIKEKVLKVFLEKNYTKITKK